MGKKEIAKRYVGLGLNISEFIKNAKTADEVLDKITEGRTVSLGTKLNLGDAQAVLQKILDQKTVSIRTALDVKDLMGIMEKSIADFEQRGSTSLAKMNRRFLEEFQTGLGSVNFKLDDGTLVGGYQKAIEQANKLNLLSERQGKLADEVAAKTRKQTAEIQQQKKATEQLATATEKATKAKTKYYEIDEKAAKIAKQMRSFDDYKEGSATASYKSAVDEMAKIVEEKKTQFPDKSDKLDQWLDRYAKNLATYINRDNQIGAQYPSVMISGAGNYNVKKHNRQMASWGKNYQYYDDNVLAIANKIKNMGSAGTDVIRSDESDALEKLEARLEYMKYWHDVMVEVNKYYRKNKTLEGFEGVEPDELERIKKDLAIIKQVGMYDVPYPQYAISNDNQNIKRIEGRIAELKRLKDNEGLKEENDIYKLWTDKQEMRIRISFEMGRPEQEIIDMLRGKSFKWSPKNNAWQRQLTSNAVYDTKRLQESLHKYYQIDTSSTDVVQQQNQLTSVIEETSQAREQDAQTTIRTLKQVTAELEQEKQKLQEINSEIERNDNAFQDFYEKQKNYGKVVLGTDTAVYDTEILSLASKELKEFNDLLATRNKFQEKYVKLRDIISKYYVGERVDDYTIDRGIYKDIDQYISQNSSMKQLNSFFQQGQKTTNKQINELFRNVVRELQSDGATVGRLLNSGEVYGAQIWKELDAEETQLNQTNQRLLAEREVQLSKIDALRQEELDLIKQQGQEERKNTEQLKFSDGTVLTEKEVSAVKKYCEVLKNSMGEAYDEALNLKAALDLVFNIKTGNIEALIDRFNASNKASNSALKIMTGMPVNNQENRNLALRSTNPSVYDQIIAEQKAAAEKAKAELANQKTDFQIKWEEFVAAMLGGDAFKNESNLVKGQILKEFSSYADTASEAIDKLNKAWLNGELKGKTGKTKYIQDYIDYLNDQKEYYDSIRNAKAGDTDVDSLFDLNSLKNLTEEKAKALRDEAAAWDQLISQKKEYYGIDSKETNPKKQAEQRTAEIQKQATEFMSVYNSLKKEFDNSTTFNGFYNKFFEDVKSGLMTSAEAIAALRKEMGGIELPESVADAAERAADAEERHANAAGETRKQLEEQKNAQSEISAEAIIERDIEQALSQLRTAKDNETTLINLKGVFSGDDLVEQFSSMVQKIAEQANLSVGKITVKDNIAQVRLYNEELKVTVDQMYQLKQATEEADSAQLELVSQSFSQNVKALNENSFDIDGFRARATAAVEKVRSSLHGLEYDLTDLEKAAGNISSKEDFAKFNNQLKAAQDNIQAIKNATVSKSSMNQLANMQRDMKNANIELETMRVKLQKIGEIDGVEDAKKMIDDMAAAAQKFNEAQDAQGQQDAYSKYSESRSSFKAQLEYLNAVKSLNASQASVSKQTIDPIKEQYKSLLDIINKINSINSDILKFQEKDAGSGLYSGYIKQLQEGKEQLVSQLQSAIQEIDATLSGGFVQGKEISIPSISFLNDNGAIANFLNDTKTQVSLTAEEIDKLVASLQKAQSIDVQAAAKVAEQFRSVQETYKQITSLSSLDTNGFLYKGVENVFAQIMQYKNMLSSDPTQWTPEQSQNLQTLINKFNEYGNVLVQVGQKEQQYFASKQKYTTDTSMQSMEEDAKKAAEEVSTAQQKLTTAAQEFAKESGASGAIITNFVQGADGIARLDFSVLDSGTNSLRKFRMEMGSVSEGTYVTETTVNNFVSKAQAAAKQLEYISDLIDRLQTSGVNIDQGSVVKLVQLQKELNAELSKGSDANETVITKLAKDAKISQAEVEKLYKKHIQLKNAIENNEANSLGSIDFNGDVYKQLAEGIKAFAKANGGTDVQIGKLNERTGQLKFTMKAADNTVREFTVDLDALGKIAVAQETSIKDLGFRWDRFKNSLSKTGKQLLTAFAGANVFYKVIAEVRKGINYVKEIDLAMTELKKVTDETEASYNNFLKTASGTASVIGSTISDFTDATSNFARLGYSMEESAKMAETAIIYRNVADGLDTVEEATDSIISTMKAFGIESNDTMGIIDRFNAVGNNFAITSAGIGEAMQRSASALREAGNTIDESIGLITAAMKNWLFIQKCIKRMHLIAGKSLEPYTTI